MGAGVRTAMSRIPWPVQHDSHSVLLILRPYLITLKQIRPHLFTWLVSPTCTTVRLGGSPGLMIMETETVPGSALIRLGGDMRVSNWRASVQTWTKAELQDSRHRHQP